MIQNGLEKNGLRTIKISKTKRRICILNLVCMSKVHVIRKKN